MPWEKEKFLGYGLQGGIGTQADTMMKASTTSRWTPALTDTALTFLFVKNDELIFIDAKY